MEDPEDLDNGAGEAQPKPQEGGDGLLQLELRLLEQFVGVEVTVIVDIELEDKAGHLVELEEHLQAKLPLLVADPVALRADDRGQPHQEVLQLRQGVNSHNQGAGHQAQLDLDMLLRVDQARYVTSLIMVWGDT